MSGTGEGREGRGWGMGMAGQRIDESRERLLDFARDCQLSDKTVRRLLWLEESSSNMRLDMSSCVMRSPRAPTVKPRGPLAKWRTTT